MFFTFLFVGYVLFLESLENIGYWYKFLISYVMQITHGLEHRMYSLVICLVLFPIICVKWHCMVSIHSDCFYIGFTLTTMERLRKGCRIDHAYTPMFVNDYIVMICGSHIDERSCFLHSNNWNSSIWTLLKSYWHNWRLLCGMYRTCKNNVFRTTFSASRMHSIEDWWLYRIFS